MTDQEQSGQANAANEALVIKADAVIVACLGLYRGAFRVLVLHKCPDEVAEINGWRFHTDGVHLNSRGGMIVPDLVQEFIDR
jgi:hypothetical protein